MRKLSLTLLAAASAAALSTAYAGEITGRVTDAEGDVPLRAARVYVAETGQVVSTERDGSFRITGLPAGEYTLDVSYIGTSSQTVSVTLPSADALSTVNVALGNEDVIVVRGQLGSLNAALNQQRNADGVVTVLSADAIAQLPDENVAEAARRALGVSIANDQGEGRFISIRGINSQLNTTSVNGIRLTSPEAGDRRVAMDVIDADVLKNIVISKTLSADMDGDSIGGAINLETISGLDRNSMLAKFKIGGIYSELSEEWGEKVSGTYANNFMDGRLGVALSGSYQSREFGSENKEVDGGWNTEDGPVPFVAEELEFRNYDVTRERMSLAANFDFMATDTTKLYLHSLYNDFSDQEYRNRLEIKVEDAIDNGGVSFGTDSVTYTSDGADSEFEIDRDIKDRLEEQRIWSVATGFEHEVGEWFFDGSVAFTHAEEEEPNRYDTNFDYTFDTPGDAITIDVSDLVLPRVSSAPADFYNGGVFELDEAEYTDGLSEDDELALTFNVRRDVMFGDNPGFVKAGLKSRQREKSYGLDFRVFEPEDDILLSEYGTTVDYPLDMFGPAINAQALSAFLAANVDNPAVFAEDVEKGLFEELLATYSADEDILAGYVMGQVDKGALRITAGVRVEQTDVSSTSNVVNEDDLDNPATINFEDDYTDVLPSIALRWDANDKTVVRAGYYASIVRPNFAQFVPAGEINDDQELEAGNPDLKRAEADNFDLLVEYYPSGSSIIQGGIFYKSIENLITSFESDVPGNYNGLDYVEINSWTNLEEATIFGVEIGYQQALDMLPAPWDGMIVGANYTYADSEADLPNGDTIRVPGQSEHIFNAIFGYDKGRWDLRAAYSFKGENIDDVDVDGVGEGRIIPDQDFLDLSAKFEITDNMKVYLDMKNALDTPLEVVERQDGYSLLNQYEEYGYRIDAGLIFQF